MRGATRHTFLTRPSICRWRRATRASCDMVRAHSALYGTRHRRWAWRQIRVFRVPAVRGATCRACPHAHRHATPRLENMPAAGTRRVTAAALPRDTLRSLCTPLKRVAIILLYFVPALRSRRERTGHPRCAGTLSAGAARQKGTSFWSFPSCSLGTATDAGLAGWRQGPRCSIERAPVPVLPATTRPHCLLNADFALTVTC